MLKLPVERDVLRYAASARALPRKEGKEWPLELGPHLRDDAADPRYHVELGAHSNIPECCIRHFINRSNITESTEAALMAGSRWRHAPCPVCRAANKHVKIHICASECPGLADIVKRANGRAYARRRTGYA